MWVLTKWMVVINWHKAFLYRCKDDRQDMYFLDCGIAFTDKATNRRNLHVTAANKAFAVWKSFTELFAEETGLYEKGIASNKTNQCPVTCTD